MMNKNQIIYLNKLGKDAKVLNLNTPSAESVEYAKIKGFNAIHLDSEHGSFDVFSLENLCRLAIGMNLTVTARIHEISEHNINLFLDRGIQGIVGPHVDTAEQGLLLANSCHYPPKGNRSWGGGRGTEFNQLDILNNKYGGKLKFAEWANNNMIVTAQIESKLAIDNLDEILEINEIDRIAFGPHDLAASLGYPGDPDHYAVKEAHKEIERKTREAGKKLWSDNLINVSPDVFTL